VILAFLLSEKKIKSLCEESSSFAPSSAPSADPSAPSHTDVIPLSTTHTDEKTAVVNLTRYAIKKVLSRKLGILKRVRIRVACSEEAFRSIWNEFSALMSFSGAKTRRLSFVIGGPVDGIITAVTRALGLPTDSWCRRYHGNWVSPIEGCSYIDMDETVKTKQKIHVRLVWSSIIENLSGGSVQKTEATFMTLSFPVSRV